MVDEAATPEAAPAPPPPTAAAGAKAFVGPALQIVNTVALVAILGVLGFQLFHPGGGHAKEARAADRGEAAPHEAKASESWKAPESAGQPGPTLRLADFVVHLRDPEAERYARISFEMELRDEKAKDIVGARMPQIRDSFLVYLSDRTADDLRGSDALARVKSALTQKLQELAPAGAVRALYMTELVVQ